MTLLSYFPAQPPSPATTPPLAMPSQQPTQPLPPEKAERKMWLGRLQAALGGVFRRVNQQVQMLPTGQREREWEGSSFLPWGTQAGLGFGVRVG